MTSELVQWTQPFNWGLLMMFDAETAWELPERVGDETIRATSTCIAVSVLHAQDVDYEALDLDDDEEIPLATVEIICHVGQVFPGSVPFDGTLECPSGRLEMGDAELHRVVEVPAGSLRVQVELVPEKYAESVTVWISSMTPVS